MSKNEEKGKASFQTKREAQGHLQMERRLVSRAMGEGKSCPGLVSSSVLCKANTVSR